MIQPLPVSHFQWLTEEEIDEMMQDLDKIKSCTLQVDLEVPQDIEYQKWFNDYLLAPESFAVSGTQKLIPNISHKKKYVVRHKTLRFYLEHELKLVNIHKGIKYKESAFLKKYIDLNNEEPQEIFHISQIEV